MLKKFLIILVIVLGITVRLYRIDAPVADWHSWRQADTASVLREFVRQGFDPLRPRYHDLSNIPSGDDNPEGWRMVEFPFYQSLGYVLVNLFPFLSAEIALRLITIFSSVLTGCLLYVLLSAIISPMAGFISLCVYLFLPFSVYYGRSILPDPLAVFWAVLSVVGVLLYSESTGWKKRFAGIIAVMAASLSLLVKPVAGFLLLPVLYILLFRLRHDRRGITFMIIYAVFSLFPFFWWRTWITQYPEGIAVYSWLFNESGIRFRGAWFRWLFAERLGALILGFYGLFPFLHGLLAPPVKKEGWLLRYFGIGALLYLVIVAQGNVQHDYYQIILLPVIAVFSARGYLFLPKITRSVTMAVSSGIVLILLSFAFSWYTVRTYYWINRPEIVEAGREANRLLPPDAKVIAPYNGDTTFLYQTGRTGWPLGFDIDEKIGMGATHYVTVSPTDDDLETYELADKYTVLVRNDRYAIIDLTKKK